MRVRLRTNLRMIVPAPAAVGLGLLLGACSDPGGPEQPMILGVTAIHAGPAVRLAVELDRAAPATVAYRAAGTRELSTSSEIGATRHQILLTRLRAGETYAFTVRAGSAEFRGEFAAPPLPDDLARIEITADGTPTFPLILLEVNQGSGVTGFRGFVIVDEEGAVVWHHRTVGAATGATRRRNGNFVFVDLGIGLVEVTPDGQVAGQLPHLPDAGIHHDVVEAADGALLFLATESRMYDGRRVVGEAVWEWRPATGALERRWSAFEHLSPADDWGTRSRDSDWLHANSLSLGPRGNMVVSLNFLNQVVSVRPDGSGLEWRLGGPNATIPVAAAAAFSGQHTAAELQGQRVMLFDNGIERSEPYSRALELSIAGPVAEAVWEFRPTPDNWSRAVSSARRLQNGHSFVAFGLSRGVAQSTGPVEVYEVDASGRVGFHLRILAGAQSLYRATPLESVGSERVVP